MQAHHLIRGEREAVPIVQDAINRGWNIDGASNGILLPDNMPLSQQRNLPMHNTNHPAYTDLVRDELTALRDEPGIQNLTDQQLITRMDQVSDRMRNYLINLGGGTRVPR